MTTTNEKKCECGSERAILKDGRCINCNLSSPHTDCKHKKALTKSGVDYPDDYVCRACNPSHTDDWRKEFDTCFWECDSIVFSNERKKELVKAYITGLLEAQRVDTEKAFGGCKNCYGKGYATRKQMISSRNWFKNIDDILPCSCDRGKQIEDILSTSIRKNQ